MQRWLRPVLRCTVAMLLATVLSAQTPNVVISPPTQIALRGYIGGLIMSTAGSSATLSVTAGVATDSTYVSSMVLAAATGKTTSSWAVGSGNGGLDTGTIANSTWYTFYIIQRVDTGVVDVIFSTNTTSPTMPTSYTLFRRIGAAKTDGSAQWTLFYQRGGDFYWDVPLNDVSTTTLSTTPTVFTLTVPLIPTGHNENIIGILHGYASNATVGAGASVLAYGSLTSAQAANTPAGNVVAIPIVTTVPTAITEIRVPLSPTTGRITLVADAASTTVQMATIGWHDDRGQNF